MSRGPIHTVSPSARPAVTAMRNVAPSLPSALEAALLEFGLMAAFRRRPRAEQGDYAGWVAGTTCPAAQRDSIAAILDQLAGVNTT